MHAACKPLLLNVDAAKSRGQGYGGADAFFFIDRRGAQAQDLFILHGIKHVHCQTLQQCIGNMTTSECTTGWGAAE